MLCLFLYGGHEDVGVMTGHIGANTRPNLYPLGGDDRDLTLLKRGCANLGRGFGALVDKCTSANGDSGRSSRGFRGGHLDGRTSDNRTSL